jgi:hypothetical protein
MTQEVTPWPKLIDYPQTEAGWNQYANAWASRRRMAAFLGQITMEAIEEHRAAMEIGRRNGWQEQE